MTKAPFDGAESDESRETRREAEVVDRRTGIPVAVVVDGANRHDMKQLAATLNRIAVARPASCAEVPQHLCSDAGYDSAAVRDEAVAHADDARNCGVGEERAAKATIPG